MASPECWLHRNVSRSKNALRFLCAEFEIVCFVLRNDCLFIGRRVGGLCAIFETAEVLKKIILLGFWKLLEHHVADPQWIAHV